MTRAWRVPVRLYANSNKYGRLPYGRKLVVSVCPCAAALLPRGTTPAAVNRCTALPRYVSASLLSVVPRASVPHPRIHARKPRSTRSRSSG